MTLGQRMNRLSQGRSVAREKWDERARAQGAREGTLDSDERTRE